MLNHMLFTGDEISSAEALRIGLVSHVFDDLGFAYAWRLLRALC